jgi:hypothetical protein
MITIEHLVDKLTKAVSYKYREDLTVPGLTIAALKKGYYCSIIRYDAAFAHGKRVICKSTKDTLLLALQDVANQFIDIADGPKDPVQELDVLLNNKQ